MKKLIYLFIVILSFFTQNSCNNSTSKSAESEIDSIKKEGFKIVWSDEFNYQGMPDSTKWSYDIEGNKWNWGNNELQNYTKAHKENSYVDGKFLHIVALKEKWENKDYTSARLITKGKGDWLYGKVEVRAKLPGGKGIWPAIWMLPTDWEYGGWPKSGEIDIMEHVGYMPDSVFATAHTESYNGSLGTQKSKGIFLPDCEREFHNYILEWDEKEYRAYVDDKQYFTFKNEGTGMKEWPFNKRFHLLLKVAVGGNWGAAKGFDKSILPQEMIVDYVRIYQK